MKFDTLKKFLNCGALLALSCVICPTSLAQKPPQQKPPQQKLPKQKAAEQESAKQEANKPDVSKKAGTKSSDAEVEIPSRVRLRVPLVRQKKMLCGPATIEMVFKYWRVRKHDQFDIAKNILLEYPTLKRVVKSGILNDKEINFKKYPGTGTSTMRKFLKLHSDVLNYYVKNMPADEDEGLKKEAKQFAALKKYIANEVPVIVLQKNGKTARGTHYRLAIGYDDEQEIVYLNDAAKGKTIKQSYEKFLSDWNVDQEYLHYNMIIFNHLKKDVTVELAH
jgi:hypothetical protein